MEKLIEQFSFGLFFWQSLLFVLLVFLLKKVAWKPILDSVNEREESIREALSSADKAKEELAALELKNENLLKEARAERDALLKDARETRESMIAESKGLAQAEADKILASAREVIENEKAAAVEELKNQVSVLALNVAEKVLREELSDDKKQQDLASKLVQDIKLN